MLLVTSTLVACGQAPKAAQQALGTVSPTPFVEATATPSPQDVSSPSPATSPGPLVPLPPLTTSYGVLVSLSAGEYDVFLIGADGKVIASAHAARRTKIMTGDAVSRAEATELPYVSATRSRVYYLDGDSTLRWMSPSSKGVAMSLPGGPTASAAFAVTPDDARIAVSVIDFAPRTPVVQMSVGPLGGPLTKIYSSASDYLWPIGWHAGKLVVGQGAIVSQGGWQSFNPYSARSYYVIDSSNAARLAAIGGSGLDECPPSGLLTAAGTACYLSTSFGGRSGGYSISDWTGYRYLPPVAASWSAAASVSRSPNSVTVAVCCETNATYGRFLVSRGTDAPLTAPLSGKADDWACWIDQSHLLSGFKDASLESVVVDLTSQKAFATGRRGFCAAVLPTDLG
jgi:hypothetical protein